MRYVDAGYSIALVILFLYAVALVLRRRRWERALRVAERGEQAERTQPTVRVAGPTEAAEHVEHVEHVGEQAAPGARS